MEEEQKYQDEFGAMDRAHYRDVCSDIFEREQGKTAKSKFLINVCSVLNKFRAVYNAESSEKNSFAKNPMFEKAMIELPYTYDMLVSTDHVLSVANIDALSWVYGWMIQVGRDNLEASIIDDAIKLLDERWFDTRINHYGILRSARYWVSIRDKALAPMFFSI